MSDRNMNELTYRDEAGAYYWVTNDAPLFVDTLEEEGMEFDREVQEAARDRYTARVVAEYRQHREENGYSQEEMMEMRNAFGSDGCVDVLTGKKVF